MRRAGERAVVDVRAERDACGGDGLGLLPAVHDERHPVSQFGAVGGKFHVREEVIRGERGVAAAQEVDVLGAVHEAQVRAALDEFLRRGDAAALDEIGPELLGDLESLVDLERLLGVDGAVGFLRRVVELAEGGVAGAGVVPGVGAFVATPSRLSKISMARSGCNSLSRTPSVALMMPAPTRTTSG